MNSGKKTKFILLISKQKKERGNFQESTEKPLVAFVSDQKGPCCRGLLGSR